MYLRMSVMHDLEIVNVHIFRREIFLIFALDSEHFRQLKFYSGFIQIKHEFRIS